MTVCCCCGDSSNNQVTKPPASSDTRIPPAMKRVDKVVTNVGLGSLPKVGLHAEIEGAQRRRGTQIFDKQIIKNDGQQVHPVTSALATGDAPTPAPPPIATPATSPDFLTPQLNPANAGAPTPAPPPIVTLVTSPDLPTPQLEGAPAPASSPIMTLAITPSQLAHTGVSATSSLPPLAEASVGSPNHSAIPHPERYASLTVTASIGSTHSRASTHSRESLSQLTPPQLLSSASNAGFRSERGGVLRPEGHGDSPTHLPAVFQPTAVSGNVPSLPHTSTPTHSPGALSTGQPKKSPRLKPLPNWLKALAGEVSDVTAVAVSTPPLTVDTHGGAADQMPPDFPGSPVSWQHLRRVNPILRGTAAAAAAYPFLNTPAPSAAATGSSQVVST